MYQKTTAYTANFPSHLTVFNSMLQSANLNVKHEIRHDTFQFWDTLANFSLVLILLLVLFPWGHFAFIIIRFIISRRQFIKHIKLCFFLLCQKSGEKNPNKKQSGTDLNLYKGSRFQCHPKSQGKTCGGRKCIPFFSKQFIFHTCEKHTDNITTGYNTLIWSSVSGNGVSTKYMWTILNVFYSLQTYVVPAWTNLSDVAVPKFWQKRIQTLI